MNAEAMRPEATEPAREMRAKMVETMQALEGAIQSRNPDQLYSVLPMPKGKSPRDSSTQHEDVDSQRADLMYKEIKALRGSIDAKKKTVSEFRAKTEGDIETLRAKMDQRIAEIRATSDAEAQKQDIEIVQLEDKLGKLTAAFDESRKQITNGRKAQFRHHYIDMFKRAVSLLESNQCEAKKGEEDGLSMDPNTFHPDQYSSNVDLVRQAAASRSGVVELVRKTILEAPPGEKPLNKGGKPSTGGKVPRTEYASLFDSAERGEINTETVDEVLNRSTGASRGKRPYSVTEELLQRGKVSRYTPESTSTSSSEDPEEDIYTSEEVESESEESHNDLFYEFTAKGAPDAPPPAELAKTDNAGPRVEGGETAVIDRLTKEDSKTKPRPKRPKRPKKPKAAHVQGKRLHTSCKSIRTVKMTQQERRMSDADKENYGSWRQLPEYIDGTVCGGVQCRWCGGDIAKRECVCVCNLGHRRYQCCHAPDGTPAPSSERHDGGYFPTNEIANVFREIRSTEQTSLLAKKRLWFRARQLLRAHAETTKFGPIMTAVIRYGYTNKPASTMPCPLCWFVNPFSNVAFTVCGDCRQGIVIRDRWNLWRELAGVPHKPRRKRPATTDTKTKKPAKVSKTKS